MKPFKRYKCGFALIETMFALLLVTIFGTSLFMLQSDIFFKTSHMHNKVVALLNINKMNSEFKLKAFQFLQQKKSLLNLSLHKDEEHPIISLSIKTEKIPGTSQLFKPFNKHLLLIKQQALFNNKTEQFIGFMFNPYNEESTQ